MVTFSYYPENGPFFSEQIDNGAYYILARNEHGPIVIDTRPSDLSSSSVKSFIDELNKIVRQWAIDKIQEETS